jgi:hypothetical protein
LLNKSQEMKLNVPCVGWTVLILGFLLAPAQAQNFPGALVVAHYIDLHGNEMVTDSFNSSDPAASTLGRYDFTKAKDSGDVTAGSFIMNSAGTGKANLYGHVVVGPDGSVAIGSQGGIGEHLWQTNNPGQIEPGWFA